MSTDAKGIFQVWKVYQRRAESLAHYLGTDVVYYHYAWEEKSKILKAVSYLLKSTRTLADLVRFQPNLIFIQLPPTPALYLVGIYAWVTRTPYVSDCHNAMLLEWWVKWPFAKALLKRSIAVLVHNKDLCEHAKRLGIDAIVVRDPLPEVRNVRATGVLLRFNLSPRDYVIVPWNLASDEPIAEFFAAVKRLPQITFVMTWFTERLSEELKRDLPGNLVFTGYLPLDEFNDLFANAGAAISLTTQTGTQPSAAAEAIAFGVPIILSGSETARLLYRNTPLYVDNNPKAITEGVEELLNNRGQWTAKVMAFKNLLNSELEDEIEMLKTRIRSHT